MTAVAKPGRPLFAASAGGHLDLLRVLAAQVLDGAEPVWVTSRTPRGEALRDTASEVELLPEFGRNPLRVPVNLYAAARLVRKHRPRVVVSSGAGVVAPFCLLARLAGARLVYIETMARVSSPSKTARLLSRYSARVLVQWPELAAALPRAVVCRPTLLENLPDEAAGDGSGTFVAVGTHRQPYDRLLGIVTRGIDDALLPESVRAQVGPARWKAPGAHVSPHLSRDELEAAMRSAAVVICHGGAGIISSALAAGRRPIVVPRRAALGEHVDDHQYQLTRKLADWGLAVVVEDRLTAADVAAARRPIRVPPELTERPTAAQVLRSGLLDPA
jgi:UDP-N-acetylglucosamine:LPS N-acetylglucosamine transferase